MKIPQVNLLECLVIVRFQHVRPYLFLARAAVPVVGAEHVLQHLHIREKSRESFEHQPYSGKSLLSVHHSWLLASRLFLAHRQDDIAEEVVGVVVISRHDVVVKLLTLVHAPAVRSLVRRNDILLPASEQIRKAELLSYKL